jgi:hypothetical protein
LSIDIAKAQGADHAILAEFIHVIPRNISLKFKDNPLTHNWVISQYIFKDILEIHGSLTLQILTYPELSPWR